MPGSTRSSARCSTRATRAPGSRAITWTGTTSRSWRASRISRRRTCREGVSLAGSGAGHGAGEEWRRRGHRARGRGRAGRRSPRRRYHVLRAAGGGRPDRRGRPGPAGGALPAAGARGRADLPAEQLAWFHLRVGDLALRHARLEDAGWALRAGLAVRPGDYRLLAALARLEAARGRWRRAIAYGEDAIAAVPDPATFGLISDAYQALGDSSAAAQYAHAMEVAVAGQPGQWHRAWSLFLLDHDRRVPEVLAKAREELATRHDIYGYDLVAWALHKQHRDREARVAMVRALALGTDDPQLRAHAAAIGR